MSESELQERTEEATPKRREESARKGQIPRSRDLGAFVILGVGFAYLAVFGEGLADDFVEMIGRYLQDMQDVSVRNGGIEIALGTALWDCVVVVTPLLVVLSVVAVFASISVGGWNLTGEALAWKWDRLSLAKGLGRIVSLRSMLEMAKAVGKVLVVGAVGTVSFVLVGDDLATLGRVPVDVGVVRGLEIVLGVSIVLLGPLALIAIVDVPMQIYQNLRQMRMTRQEIKEEMKNTEGRPEVRGRIRRLQQELATRRMMESVKDADVVVNNPTHFSVAIKYDEETMRAPVVVAIGKDLMAHRIRLVASDSDVMQVQWPMLARALYGNVSLGEEIPVTLYVAVAKVLTYVFSIRTGSLEGTEKTHWTNEDIPAGMVNG